MLKDGNKIPQQGLKKMPSPPPRTTLLCKLLLGDNFMVVSSLHLEDLQGSIGRITQ